MYLTMPVHCSMDLMNISMPAARAVDTPRLDQFMDDKALVKADIPEGEDLLQLLFYGNIDNLKPEQKAKYLLALCKNMGISPWTKPFDIMVLNGKTVVYANKGAASQLRATRGITVEVLYSGPLRMGKDQNGMDLFNNEIYSVEVKAIDKEGRCSYNIGVVSIKQKAGEPLANEIMKCYTKATRRVVLDHVGLGIPDESEIDTLPRQQEASVQSIQVRK